MPRRNPEKLAHPSSGNGTLSHLGMEVFKQRAGITILHVPYRGSVPAMTDLMTGIVGVAMDTVAVTEPFIRGDKMRLIASAYGKRVASFPDTPTVAEQGFPEVDLSAWLGIVVVARRRRRGSIVWAPRSTRSCSRPRYPRSSPVSARSRARDPPSSARFSPARTRAGAPW